MFVAVHAAIVAAQRGQRTVRTGVLHRPEGAFSITSLPRIARGFSQGLRALAFLSFRQQQGAVGTCGSLTFPAGFVLAGFSDASAREGGCLRGASQGAAGSVRAHQKGCEFLRRHGLYFFSALNRLGNRLGLEFFLSGGTPMDQREFPLLGRLDAPSAVPNQWIRHATTYRHAVRLAWQLRRVQSMTRQQLATEAELYPQHVTDYLAPDDKPRRRDLPADKVAAFEGVVGNTLVSQWLAGRSQLTVPEEMQATRAAA